MRILYLSQLVPYPADAGPKVRIYHVLQYLVEAGHEVTLVAFHRPGDTPEAFDKLRQMCAAVHTVPMVRSRLRDAKHLAHSLVFRQPFLIDRDHVDEMHTCLRELMTRQRFDAVHADQLWMAQYALAAKRYSGQNGSLQTVLDQHNAVYLIPKRLAAGTNNPFKKSLLELEWRKMAAYETETCRLFDHVVWVTDEDQGALAQVAGGPAADLTIPICVDPHVKPVVERGSGARRVTFLGGLHWPPNAEGILWFAREVWPQIVAQVPDALLTVIGKNPPAELTQLNENNIDVTGYVDDPIPYLEETAAFIVPLHAGGGMRVKIIDAWSWGLPIVSTTIGAEGIQYAHGNNLLIADTAETFAKSVTHLLFDFDAATQLAMQGRKTVETHYNWHTVYRAWDQIYEVVDEIN